ncbi:MAG: DUF4105 domain-containing protein [bacterium]|nr:DUF4105 domain-containing protein [bacterium]
MKTRIIKSILKKTVISIAYVLLILIYVWCIPAVYFMSMRAEGFYLILTFGFAVLLPFLFFCLYKKKYKIYILYGLCLIVIIFFTHMIPFDNKNWIDSVAVMPSVSFDKNLVSVRNIRNFDYETEFIYKIDYYNKTFDINSIKSVDYILSYWDDNIYIAHTLLRFGFDNGSHICVSVETRLEKGEPQSGLRGLYNQYELIYILADESDILMLRTNYRKEKVYVFPFKGTKEDMERLFWAVMKKVQHLEHKPEFYNTLKENCLTSLTNELRKIKDRKILFDYRYILNGQSDKLGYERGLFTTNEMNFKEFKKKHYINQYISDKTDKNNYSQVIRDGMRH